MLRSVSAAVVLVAALSATGAAAFQAPAAQPAARGATLWTARYNGPGNGNDRALAAAIGPHGADVFVTGSSAGTGGRLNYTTIAYRAGTGKRLWVSRYGGPGFLAATPWAVAVSPSGGTVFVTGIAPARSGSGQSDRVHEYVTVAYNARTGARLWVSGYNGPPAAVQYVRSTALAVSPDGQTVYLDGATSQGFATVAYNAATGVRRWADSFTPADYQSFDATSKLTVSPDGRAIYVAMIAGAEAPKAPAISTVAYAAATGKQLWQRSAGYFGASVPGMAALAITPDGKTVIVAGTSQPAHQRARYLTVGYDAASGAQLWARTYGGIRSGDYAAALTLSPTGSTAYVTGLSTSLKPTVFATVAYRATTGAQAWVRDYQTNPGPVQVAGLATGRSGTLYLAGTLGYNWYATIAYSPAGRRIWVRRLGKPNSVTVASAIVVSPASGAVYVTGFTGGQSARSDNYLTVAYHG